jgi:hypothetical protein
MIWLLFFAIFRNEPGFAQARPSFLQQKIQLTKAQRASSEKFLALFDNGCLRAHKTLVKQKPLLLFMQAYSLEKKDLTLDLETHPCLLGLTVDQALHTSALPTTASASRRLRATRD